MSHRDEEPETDGGGELRPEDVRRRFEEMVAGLDTPSADELPKAEEPPEPVTPAEEPTLLELWDAELPDDEEDEEEYRAPEPPPIPWPSLPAVGGVVFILGGLVMLIRPDFTPLGTNPGRLVGFVVFIVGVWILINRLRDDSSEDDDPGNGAVV
jgi:hypothetical protein